MYHWFWPTPIYSRFPIQVALCTEGEVHHYTMEGPILRTYHENRYKRHLPSCSMGFVDRTLDAEGLNLFEVIGETMKEDNHLNSVGG